MGASLLALAKSISFYILSVDKEQTVMIEKQFGLVKLCKATLCRLFDCIQ